MSIPQFFGFVACFSYIFYFEFLSVPASSVLSIWVVFYLLFYVSKWSTQRIFREEDNDE